MTTATTTTASYALSADEIATLAGAQQDRIVFLSKKSARNLVTAIAKEEDTDVLRALVTAEEQGGRPRKTVLGALTLRIDELAPVVEIDEPTETAPEPTEEPKAEEVPTSETAPEPTEGETAPTVERTPTENCAAAFFKALSSGDAKLVAVLLNEVRAEDANDAEMAAALVSEFAKTATAKPGRKARKARTSRNWQAPSLSSEEIGAKAAEVLADGSEKTTSELIALILPGETPNRPAVRRALRACGSIAEVKRGSSVVWSLAS